MLRCRRPYPSLLLLFVLLALPGGASATIQLVQIFTEASGAVPGFDYFVLAPSFTDPLSVVSQGSVSATGPLGTTASAQSIASGPAGHIGAYASGSAVPSGSTFVSIGGGASGKISYLLTLDPGDALLVVFSVNGSLSGDASAIANIFDEIAPSRLNLGYACFTSTGCVSPNVQSAWIYGTGPGPTPYRLTMSLGVHAGFDEAPFSEANFLNSLDVSFVAAAGSSISDAYGLISVPEPSLAILALSTGALAAAVRRRPSAGRSNALSVVSRPPSRT